MTCVEKSQVMKRRRQTPFKLTHETLLTMIVGQSMFLVEVSLRDETAWRLLSRGILSVPFVPKDGSLY